MMPVITGGTVDLTAHEVLSSGGVKEIHTSISGPWGGAKVDDNFVKLLEEVLGSYFIHTFQKQCPQQMVHVRLVSTFHLQWPLNTKKCIVRR